MVTKNCKCSRLSATGGPIEYLSATRGPTGPYPLDLHCDSPVGHDRYIGSPRADRGPSAIPWLIGACRLSAGRQVLKYLPTSPSRSLFSLSRSLSLSHRSLSLPSPPTAAYSPSLLRAAAPRWPPPDPAEGAALPPPTQPA